MRLFVQTYQAGENPKHEFSKTFAMIPQKIIYTDQDLSPDLSTGDIVKAMREASGKVELVCHGKGAADCLETLLVYPELQKKVVRFISFNGLIQGAHYANKAFPPPEAINLEKASKMGLLESLSWLKNTFVNLWQGHPSGYYAMNSRVRLDYISRNWQGLKILSKKVPLVSLNTEKGPVEKVPFFRQEKLSQFEKNQVSLFH